MIGGTAEGAHINDNSSFHTLPVNTKGIQTLIPEFLDEFGETGHEIGSIFMEFFAVLFILVGWIDDGDFGEVVHVGTVGFIGLEGDNCGVEEGIGGALPREDVSVLCMSMEGPDALQRRPSRPEHRLRTRLVSR